MITSWALQDRGESTQIKILISDVGLFLFLKSKIKALKRPALTNVLKVSVKEDSSSATETQDERQWAVHPKEL